MSTITIRLNVDLPINAKHKCVRDAEFKVYAKKGRRDALYYFKDELGNECAAYHHECQIIEGDESLLPNRNDKSEL